MSEPAIIAVLGAESTGKSELAATLGASLADAGLDVVVVPELLRAFCAEQGRTPRADEQTALARAQSGLIRQAAAQHALVIADTTSLMTAVYSDLLFDDPSLYAEGLQQQRACRLTLLMGLDLPWVADGIQRDGPRAQSAVDARLRDVLQEQHLPFSVVYGAGRARADAALGVVWRCLRPPVPVAGQARWRWTCQHCGDGACEAASHRLSR